MPKYSKYEIRTLVQGKLNEAGENNIRVDRQLITDLLNEETFWQSSHYIAAAEILETTPQNLVAMIPKESLDSISFRAEENTEEINHVVEEVNDIFELLAYQLKIGGTK